MRTTTASGLLWAMFALSLVAPSLSSRAGESSPPVMSSSKVGRTLGPRLREPGGGAASAQPACGRDCAFLVLQRLGCKATLEHIDALLEHRSKVSLAELRRLFEAYGLHCRAVLLTPRNAGRIATLLHEAPAERAAIAALATGEPVGHFVVLQDASDDELVVMDAGPGTQHRVAFGALRETEIPTVLVARQPWGDALALERRWLPARIVARAATSWWFAAGLGVAALVALGLALGGRPAASAARGGVWLARHIAGGRSLNAAVALCMIGSAAVAAWYSARLLYDPVSVEPAILDLGRRPVGSQQKVTLRLLNRSFFSSLEVTEVRASCSCLTPRCARPSIAPRGETTVEVDAWIHLAGPAQYILLVNVGRGRHVLRVPVRFEGYQDASLSPAEIALGAFPPGMRWRRSTVLRVTGYKGKPVRLRVAASAGKVAGVRPVLGKDAVLRPGGRILLHVDTLPDAPLGSFTERVVLGSLEDVPKTFVVTVHGAIVEPVGIVPGVVILPKGATETRETVRVQARFGELVIERVWIDTEGILVESSANDASGMCIVLRRTPTAVARTARLLIQLRRPVEKLFELPVYLSPLSEHDGTPQ